MFTKRELEVLCLIADGYSTEAIAHQLCRTTETIKSHRKNIIRKIRQSHDSSITLLQFAITYAKEIEKSP